MESVDLFDISLHILDIAENGLTAGATLIEIELEKDAELDLLQLIVTDNGSGISTETFEKVVDPFYTTRTTRRIGMGLSLLKQAAEDAGGGFSVESEPGQGSTVRARFQLSHLDRPPIGDMASTLMTLIVGNPEADFVYVQKVDEREFGFDTREIRAALDGAPLDHPEVTAWLRESLAEGLEELGAS